MDDLEHLLDLRKDLMGKLKDVDEETIRACVDRERKAMKEWLEKRS